ncbi:outer membrane protein OmpA-like peptidoglycan-associated protein [Marinobacter sp. MBR-99]|jgi:outer membrane protein OmpA-like peptidoglycan-associated protein|uniref:flagellar protein MotY n=1 Tax=Marinobacter sp. MBR-99 TaxID=3156461 RepID=UPI00339B72FF
MTSSLRHLVHKKLAAAGMSALFAVATAPVWATSYGAGIENSQWYLSESVFECSLVHEVPGYGRAVFRHRAGEALSFYLESEIPLMRPGRGELVVEAPAWRPGVAPRAIGAVTVSDQPRAVTVSSREATLMTQGLLQGMQPTVTRAARYDDRPVRVQISNINFSGPYSGYRECVSSLLPVNYDQIRRSRVPFASGSTSLSEADRRLLDNIVTYVMADSTVERVFVDGHSDSVGSRIDNRALSEERANVVADYLRSRGINDDLLIVRAHGDQFPVSRRHADNRRTTIRLQRQGERPELQQANGPGMDFSG